jgi:metal-responsive CopG/Arc/MetJ family transcriptional regulator
LTDISEQINIRLPEKLKLKVDGLAEKKYSSRSQIVREAMGIGLSIIEQRII